MALSLPRPVKRSRHLNVDEANLPVEMWGAVMNYLDFSSALSMTAASRAMRDAALFVSDLHVHDSCQMHVSVGRRFTGVSNLFIYSLVQVSESPIIRSDDDEENGVYLACECDFETSLRAVPFVSSFANPKTVYFGAKDDGGFFYQVIPYHRFESYSVDSGENVSILISSISAGFNSGLLSHSLQVKGLSCLHDKKIDHYICLGCGGDNADFNGSSCYDYVVALRSFPIQAVAEFELASWRGDLTIEGNFHSLHVCLGRDRMASSCRENQFELCFLVYCLILLTI